MESLGLFMFLEKSRLFSRQYRKFSGAGNPDFAELEMIWTLTSSQSQILLGFILPAYTTGSKIHSVAMDATFA